MKIKKIGIRMMERKITEINVYLNESEQENLQLFLQQIKMKSKDKSAGAIGGSITYHITHTGIGTSIKVSDSMSGLEADITDYGSW